MTPTPHPKKLASLQKARVTKQQAALQRALAALQAMQEQALPINFESVANYAQVSKVWLYRQPELSDQIKALRHKADVPKRTTDIHQQLQQKEQEIITLNKKVKGLENTIVKLRTQLEIVYGQLYKANQSTL